MAAKSSRPKKSDSQERDKVVLLLHGIRTQASWTEMVAKLLGDGAKAKVVPIKYGFLDTFRFLCPVVTRKAPISKFIQEYRDVRLSNPGLPISVIAHSFGTYVVAKALARETDIIFDRIVFCGCIVAPSFRVAPFRAQLGKSEILNDCGTHDVWPIFASSITWGFGSTGTFGFGTQGIRDRFNKFTHSSYFDREFIKKFWVPFFVDGTIKSTDWEVDRPNPPYWQSLLGRIPLRWLFPLVVVVGMFSPDISVYRRGPNIKIDDVAYIGHWVGSPRIYARIRIENGSLNSLQALITKIELTSPSGKIHTLISNRVDGCYLSAPMTIKLTPFIYMICGYEFLGDQSRRRTTDPEVDQLFVLNKVSSLLPDKSRNLITGELLEKLQKISQTENIWVEGQWQMKIHAMFYDMNGNIALGNAHESSSTHIVNFDVTAQDIDYFISGSNFYHSGVGVFYMWLDAESSQLRSVKLNEK